MICPQKSLEVGLGGRAGGMEDEEIISEPTSGPWGQPGCWAGPQISPQTLCKVQSFPLPPKSPADQPPPKAMTSQPHVHRWSETGRTGLYFCPSSEAMSRSGLPCFSKYDLRIYCNVPERTIQERETWVIKHSFLQGVWHPSHSLFLNLSFPTWKMGW